MCAAQTALDIYQQQQNRTYLKIVDGTKFYPYKSRHAAVA